MAEVLVEKKICISCGSEVRDGSVFCFNCGETVIVEPPPPAIVKPVSGPFNGRRTEAQTERLDSEPEPPPVSPPVSPLEVPAPKRAITEEPQAAGLTRREPRPPVRKKVEMEWVERSTTPYLFFGMAVALTILAGLLIAAAIYLK